ncbi:unnamed protein product [Colletotrichum noveboracense]|uniref:Uncharacterized protein n=1 Tax=Colletotrichum noveboracense TaxID=2664923 RepID=A0A9W4WK27_9PEZI|nr:unnamed protein product [Colletotrichum noveboracense]
MQQGPFGGGGGGNSSSAGAGAAGGQGQMQQQGQGGIAHGQQPILNKTPFVGAPATCGLTIQSGNQCGLVRRYGAGQAGCMAAPRAYSYCRPGSRASPRLVFRLCLSRVHFIRL